MITLKINRNLIGLFLSSFLTVLLVDCHSHKRDFFQKMNNKIIDLRIDSNYYFIKSFNLSSNSVKINAADYWALKSDKKSLFHLTGYLRKLNDSIMMIPLNFKNVSPEEYKLFDFSKKKGSWEVIYETDKFISKGDSIVLSKLSVSKNRDTTFTFSLYPFTINKFNHRKYYIDPVFELEVRRDYGITVITELKASRIGFTYRAILHPKQIFINNRGDVFDL